jgi:hypothetical protein
VVLKSLFMRLGIKINGYLIGKDIRESDTGYEN